MSSQDLAEQPVTPDEAATLNLPDRTKAPAEGEAPQGEMSKNAAKKAAKMAKQAAEKGQKEVNKGVAKEETKKGPSKAPKKKIEGAALIGIDVAKEDDFASWYQQVLTKGDMLDYYDVSGCFILKVMNSGSRYYCCSYAKNAPACLVLYLGTDPTMVQREDQEDGR